MTSTIFLENIQIYAYHGVLPEENRIGTNYILNIEVDTNFWKATETDNLEDTISYADINDIVHKEMAISSKLLEHVTGRIIKKTHLHFPQITRMKVKITKVSPPMLGQMDGASILLEKHF